MQETKKTQVLPLGREDPLEEEVATHSSILGDPTDRGAWWAPVHRVSNSEHALPKMSNCRAVQYPRIHLSFYQIKYSHEK